MPGAGGAAAWRGSRHRGRHAGTAHRGARPARLLPAAAGRAAARTGLPGRRRRCRKRSRGRADARAVATSLRQRSLGARSRHHPGRRAGGDRRRAARLVPIPPLHRSDSHGHLGGPAGALRAACLVRDPDPGGRHVQPLGAAAPAAGRHRASGDRRAGRHSGGRVCRRSDSAERIRASAGGRGGRRGAPPSVAPARGRRRRAAGGVRERVEPSRRPLAGTSSRPGPAASAGRAPSRRSTSRAAREPPARPGRRGWRGRHRARGTAFPGCGSIGRPAADRDGDGRRRRACRVVRRDARVRSVVCARTGVASRPRRSDGDADRARNGGTARNDTRSPDRPAGSDRPLPARGDRAAARQLRTRDADRPRIRRRPHSRGRCAALTRALPGAGRPDR